jgi:hypothetical protein
MKLILTNVTSANVKQVKALIVVATNLAPTATTYTPDSFDAKYASGYNELSNAYWGVPFLERKNFVLGANPFEEGTPQFFGYNQAVSDFEHDKLLYKRPIIRWRLEATGNSPSDVNLLLRFAHTLGKTYQNVDVTIQE